MLSSCRILQVAAVAAQVQRRIWRARSGCCDDGRANALNELANTSTITGEIRLLYKREPAQMAGQQANDESSSQAGRKRQCVSCVHPIQAALENGEDEGEKRGDGR